MVIYVDILLLLNLFINYFLLLATARFCHVFPRRRRMILAAAAGSLFSLTALLPAFSFFLQLLFKLAMAALLVFIAFGRCAVRIYIKTLGLFFGVNFLFAGVMLALWLTLPLKNMLFRNGFVYFDISALTLALSTVAAYLVICVIKKIFDRAVAKKEIYHLKIETDGKQVLLKGFYDSGNRLSDSFTGLPVAVCEIDAIEPLIPRPLLKSFRSSDLSMAPDLPVWRARIRVIPCHTVGTQGLMLCFRPDAVYIGDDKSTKQNALIGVTASKLSDGEYEALIGPNFTLPKER